MTRVAVALAAAAVLAAAPAAAAKTIKVDWREQKTLASGGSLKFRVTKIVATMRSWAVTARITNASPAAVGIEPKGQAFAFPTPHPWWRSGMALLELHRERSPFDNAIHVQWWQWAPTAVRPAFPRSLKAGASWSGTFGGSAKLQRGHSYNVGFGPFFPQALAEGGRTVFWITDHGFTV